MRFGVRMDPFRIHMEVEGRPIGGLGAKPPEKAPLGLSGPLLALLYEAINHHIWDVLVDNVCASKVILR